MEESKSKMTSIDLAQLGNLPNTETVLVDPSANAFDRAKPVTDARYRAVLSASTDTEALAKMISQIEWKDRDGKMRKDYSVNFEVELTEFADATHKPEELQGKARKFKFERVSTFDKIVDGKPTSEIATLLSQLGMIAQAGSLFKEDMVRAFVGALAAKPQIGVVTQVQGSIDTGVVDKKAKSKRQDGSDYTVRKTVLYGEKQFPVNPDGSRNFEVQHLGKPVQVRAVIDTYFRLQ